MNYSFGIYKIDLIRALIVSLLIPLILPAQNNTEYTLEYFNDSHTLSQNYIMDIHQDRTGFLWIATRDGLNRYDGYNVKVFRKNNRDTNSICGNFIECIFEDSKGYLWFGSYEGFSKYDPRTEKFTNFSKQLNNSLSFRNKSINSIVEDELGVLWLGTTAGLFTFNPDLNTFKKFKHNKNKSNSIPPGSSKVFKDKAGNIWIVSGGKIISQYDKELNSFFTATREIANPITTLWDNGNDFIYVNTSQKDLFKIRKSDKIVVDLTNLNLIKYNDSFISESVSGKVYLINNKLISLFDADNYQLKTVIESEHSYPISLRFKTFEKTEDGVIWAGTNGYGLYKFIPRRTKFRTLTYNSNAKNGLTMKSIRGIYLDSNGSLWIGGYSALNVIHNFKTKMESTKLQKMEITTVKTFNKKNIYAIIEDPFDENILWIGTEFFSLIKYNKRTGKKIKYNKLPEVRDILTGDRFYKFLIDSNKNLWVGTNKGVFKIDVRTNKIIPYYHNNENSNSISKGKVWALMEDSDGMIWLGTPFGGVSLLNPKNNEIIRYESVDGDTTSLSSNFVYSIFEDKNKVVWIGTKSGLNKFDRESSTFKTYSEEDGLANDCIYAIIEDQSENLWLSSNKGISKYDIDENQFVNYDKSFGLQDNEFNGNAYFKDDFEMIYFGGINGLTLFNPDEIKHNNYIPRVGVTNFQKFNKDVQLDKSISFIEQLDLSYKDYFFSFEFTSFDFSYPNKNKFAYKLEGFDNDWITTTANKRFAVYTNINPGEYTLKVKASNNNDVWNTTARSIKIVIFPPYWETWWFRMLSVFAMMLFVFLLYRRRINGLKREKNLHLEFSRKLIDKQEEERQRISGELHDGIGQHLLVIKNNLVLAQRDNTYEEQINDSLGLLGKTITDISNISHYLRPSELDQLGLILAIDEMLERIQRASGIKINSDIIETFDDYFTKDEHINIFRIFQEAMNNILKHSKALEVNITTNLKGNNLAISIKDNGVGFETSELNKGGERPHVGIAGMRERISMLNGTFVIDSEVGKGTEVILNFVRKEIV